MSGYVRIYSVIATVGPEGLCPMLLVFVTLPRPAKATPAQSQIERSTTIRKAIDLVVNLQARRRIRFGLRNSHGPKGKEIWREFEKLTIGSK